MSNTYICDHPNYVYIFFENCFRPRNYMVYLPLPILVYDAVGPAIDCSNQPQALRKQVLVSFEFNCLAYDQPDY